MHVRRREGDVEDDPGYISPINSIMSVYSSVTRDEAAAAL